MFPLSVAATEVAGFVVLLEAVKEAEESLEFKGKV